MKRFAGKAASVEARVSVILVLDTARETVARVRAVWDKEKMNLPMATAVADVIDDLIPHVPIARGE